MTATVTKVTTGRGAWSKVGGTLSEDGTKPGPYYCKPAGTSKEPGSIGYTADRTNGPCNVNDYAVYMAVKAIQKVVGVSADGLFGPMTSTAVKKYQTMYSLVSDGVVGPNTAKHMFSNMLLSLPVTTNLNSSEVRLASRGHVSWESGWDPGAVGGSTPDDLGLGQINGPSHPDMSVEERFDPKVSLAWILAFVEGNMQYLKVTLNTPVPPMPASAIETKPVNLNEYTDAIAAYNLGKGGASNWRNAGRKQFYGTANVDVWKYIYSVRKAAI